MHGLTHFVKAARKRSLDDPIWKEFVHRLVLTSNSALVTILLNRGDDYIEPRVSNRIAFYVRSCARSESGKLRILPSHLLVCLPVWDENDYADGFSVLDVFMTHDRVELLKDMYTIAGNFDSRLIWYRRHPLQVPKHRRWFELGGYYPKEVNALHLACVYENTGAVRAVLHATK